MTNKQDENLSQEEMAYQYRLMQAAELARELGYVPDPEKPGSFGKAETEDETAFSKACQDFLESGGDPAEMVRIIKEAHEN
ncbi:hypothetical protein CN135_25105 [Sinorhizobium meliloti]|uniref:hypothetical protein n=1 Tax=Rhizobium meliloti TaxID=382 RepID=UPI000FD918F6|nr:hypothetical protein [Sinorhizobium meliloti]RVL75340.1 hypothetical protein CN135_25105 [Sinorhizobium meliloti]